MVVIIKKTYYVFRKLTKVYKKLLADLKNDKFSNDCIELEHRVTEELEIQTENGFKIDLNKANDLYSSLNFRMREIEAQHRAGERVILTAEQVPAGHGLRY